MKYVDLLDVERQTLQGVVYWVILRFIALLGIIIVRKLPFLIVS